MGSTVCKGRCISEFGATYLPTGGTILYRDGAKFCRPCAVRIHWKGVYCPCCNYRLRTHPRDKAAKTDRRRVA